VYEQFLQVNRLDGALIVLGLTLYLPSISVSYSHRGAMYS